MATWQFYNKWRSNKFGSSAINFAGGNIKILLVKSGANIGGNGAPTSAANLGDSGLQHVADLVPGTNEVTGTNYSRQALGSPTVSEASGVVTFAGTGTSYAQSASGFTNAEYPVLFYDTGSDATALLVAAADLGASVGNVAGTLTINTDTGNAVFTES